MKNAPFHPPLNLLEGACYGCGRGGIGRRAALRSLWGNPWKFESSRPHHRKSAESLVTGVRFTFLACECCDDFYRLSGHAAIAGMRLFAVWDRRRAERPHLCLGWRIPRRVRPILRFATRPVAARPDQLRANARCRPVERAKAHPLKPRPRSIKQGGSLKGRARNPSCAPRGQLSVKWYNGFRSDSGLVEKILNKGSDSASDLGPKVVEEAS